MLLDSQHKSSKAKTQQMITTSTARQWQESQRRQQRNSFRFPSGWPHKAYKPAPLVAICMTAHIRVDNNIDNLESHCKSRNSNIPIEVNTTWINMISQFKIINNMLIQHHNIYIYIWSGLQLHERPFACTEHFNQEQLRVPCQWEAPLPRW